MSTELPNPPSARDDDLTAAAPTRSLGVVVPVILNPFVEKLTHALQTECEKRGYVSMTSASFSDPAREAQLIAHFQSIHADGVIVVSPAQPPEALRALADEIPLMLVAPDPVGGRADATRTDEDRAAEMVIDHLISRGWDSLVYVPWGLEVDANWRNVKQEALERVARDRGIELRVAAVVDSPAGLVATTAQTWRARHSAVIAHTGMIGLELARAMQADGIVLGRDVGLVAYDDAFLLKDSGLDVTAIDLDLEVCAAMIMDMLHWRITGHADAPGQVVLGEPHLTVGSST